MNNNKSDIDNLVNFSRGYNNSFFLYWAIGIQPTLPRNRNVRSERRSDERHRRRRRRRARKNETVSLPPPLSFFSTRCRFPDSRTLLPHQEKGEEEVFCASRDEKESSKVERCGPVCSVKNRSNRFVRRLPKKKGKESLF